MMRSDYAWRDRALVAEALAEDLIQSDKRLRKQLRIATAALECIAKAECAACEITVVEEALTQMSVADDGDERALAAARRAPAPSGEE